MAEPLFFFLTAVPFLLLVLLRWRRPQLFARLGVIPVYQRQIGDRRRATKTSETSYRASTLARPSAPLWPQARDRDLLCYRPEPFPHIYSKFKNNGPLPTSVGLSATQVSGGWLLRARFFPFWIFAYVVYAPAFIYMSFPPLMLAIGGVIMGLQLVWGYYRQLQRIRSFLDQLADSMEQQMMASPDADPPVASGGASP